MSNELLNAYIKFGEPDGDDLDFSQIADWAGYLLQEQRERIAELEAKNRHLHSLVKQLGDKVGETALKNQRLLDTIAMYESWMKRKPAQWWGTVWDDICREYPYLATEKET